eukprot:scaffold450_cov115-Pinguiococcus_pyrenoidosus.AAC.1
MMTQLGAKERPFRGGLGALAKPLTSARFSSALCFADLERDKERNEAKREKKKETRRKRKEGTRKPAGEMMPPPDERQEEPRNKRNLERSASAGRDEEELLRRSAFRRIFVRSTTAWISIAPLGVSKYASMSLWTCRTDW